MNVVANSTLDDGDIDLRGVIIKLWSKRIWILASVILTSAVFAAAASLMTPVYRAAVVAVPSSGDRTGVGPLGSALGQLGGLASLAGINLSSGTAGTEEALAVLRSRQFTETFIEEKHLMPELFYKQWDAGARQWRGEAEDWPTPAQASRYFREHVSTVSHDKKTGLVSVQIEWRNPAMAAQWANELVARLNAEMRSRAIASTTASVGYLHKELTTTSEIDTRTVINRLLEAQINQRMFASVTQEYALRVVDQALPPDSKDIARPKKLVMLVLGPLVGIIVGVVAVLLAGALVQLSPRATRL